MGAGSERAQIGEVEVLGDEEAACALCRTPNIRVAMPLQPLLRNRVDLMAKS